MATTTTTVRGVVPGTKLRVGSLIMAIGGLGFIGYAVIFFVNNFTGFLDRKRPRGSGCTNSQRRCARIVSAA
jgi:hypothetical protein